MFFSNSGKFRIKRLSKLKHVILLFVVILSFQCILYNSYYFVDIYQYSNNKRLLTDDVITDHICDNNIERKFHCKEDDCAELCDLFNYIYGYYCGVFSGIHWFGLIAYFYIIAFFIYLMGDTVDEYLCNILQSMVLKFRISPNNACVTFYSIGNGAVDVLIVISSFVKDHSELGLCATFSSGIFVCTICLAAIMMIKTFETMKAQFVRDITFFLVTVGYILIMYSDGVVKVYEVIVFILLYFIFVGIIVIFGDCEGVAMKCWSLWNRYRKNSAFTSQSSIENGGSGGDINVPLNNTVKRRKLSFVDSLSSPTSDHRVILERRRIYTLNNDDEGSHGSEVKLTWKHVFTTEGQNESILHPFHEGDFEPQPYSYAFTILKNDLKECLSVPIFYYFFTVPMIPFDIFRRLFIPLYIPDYYSKTFIITSMLGFPFFFALVVDLPLSLYYLLLYSAIALLLTLIVLLFADTNIHQNHWIITSLIIIVGFVNSIFLLYLIASELIVIIHSISLIINTNHTILGILLLGIGDSISDFMSNVNISRQGFPEMAIASCFSTPVFQLLVGLGIGFIIQLVKFGNANIVAEMSSVDLTMVFMSLLFLLGAIFSTIIIIPLTSKKYAKYYGIYLVLFYISYIVISILRTLNILDFDLKFT